MLAPSLSPSPSSLERMNQSQAHVRSHDNHTGKDNHSHSHHHHHHHQPHQHHHHHDHHHGHSHMTVDMFKDKSDSMFSFFILMFATSIHSLFEGKKSNKKLEAKSFVFLLRIINSYPFFESFLFLFFRPCARLTV